jgi:hypothetical protein
MSRKIAESILCFAFVVIAIAVASAAADGGVYNNQHQSQPTTNEVISQ